VIEEEMHINEEPFADLIFKAFLQIMDKGSAKLLK